MLDGSVTQPCWIWVQFISPNHQNTTPGGAKVGWKLKSRKKVSQLRAECYEKTSSSFNDPKKLRRRKPKQNHLKQPSYPQFWNSLPPKLPADCPCTSYLMYSSSMMLVDYLGCPSKVFFKCCFLKKSHKACKPLRTPQPVAVALGLGLDINFPQLSLSSSFIIQMIILNGP